MSEHIDSDDCLCFKCKIRTIQWSPAATPSRRNAVAPRKPQNSWERGIARDERGMPLLKANGDPVGLHEMASKRGHIEARVRELKNTPPDTPAPPAPAALTK